MAAVTNIDFSIDRNADNAVLGGAFDLEFDELTNLPYRVSVRLYGDDTSQDGDDLPPGDDPLWRRLVLKPHIRANGRPSVHLEIKDPKDGEDWEFGYDELDEDEDDDDEVRMVITLTPLLPDKQTFESEALVLTAP